MPLIRRLPKRGFNNAAFKKKIAIVKLEDLASLDVDDRMINEAVLRAYRLVRGRFDGIKVLGDGTISRRVQVEADAFSASARAKIEAAGGEVFLRDRRQVSLFYGRSGVRQEAIVVPPSRLEPVPTRVSKDLGLTHAVEESVPVPDQGSEEHEADLEACQQALAAWIDSPAVRLASARWRQVDVNGLFRAVEAGEVPADLAALNVHSVGIGWKRDRATGRLRHCLRFRVLRRFSPEELATHQIASLPEFERVLTDVVASAPLVYLDFPGEMCVTSFCRVKHPPIDLASDTEFFLSCQHVIEEDPSLRIIGSGGLSQDPDDRSLIDAAVAVLPVPRQGVRTSAGPFTSLQVCDVSATEKNELLGKFSTSGQWQTARISEFSVNAWVFQYSPQGWIYRAFFSQQILLVDKAGAVFARPGESGSLLFLAASDATASASASSHATVAPDGRNRCCAMLIAGSTGRPDDVKGFHGDGQTQETYLASSLSQVQTTLKIDVIP